MGPQKGTGPHPGLGPTAITCYSTLHNLTCALAMVRAESQQGCGCSSATSATLGLSPEGAPGVAPVSGSGLVFRFLGLRVEVYANAVCATERLELRTKTN